MPEKQSVVSNIEIKKVLWNCRRGMLELDVILIPFAKAHFDQMAATEQALFVRLLEEADPDLFNWLMGNGLPSDVDLARMVKHIREIHHQ